MPPFAPLLRFTATKSWKLLEFDEFPLLRKARRFWTWLKRSWHPINLNNFNIHCMSEIILFNGYSQINNGINLSLRKISAKNYLNSSFPLTANKCGKKGRFEVVSEVESGINCWGRMNLFYRKNNKLVN